ncbi:hypothetical protein HHK36_026750 [Tetracentron sinense]|uniref:Cell division control protein 73 C-terminal domain-containing protein n=1 Tax=Tetracentron sinense TaxID=13715 RepID=A0A835D5S1_TETSI|nr:hypothetical protein HHK36_026750 [Tetracentron sinense]
MDPLSALRDFTIRDELDKIVRVGDEFQFGSDYVFPCSAETAYRSKPGNLCTLETLVYYVKNHHIKHMEYLRNALTQKIPPVTLPDRKPLLVYLQGKVPQNPRISDALPVDVGENRPEERLIGIGAPCSCGLDEARQRMESQQRKDGLVAKNVKVKKKKGPKPDCVTVQKKFSLDRVVAAYDVRDKPSTLKAEDWDRVVAVFVLGKESQFKDWPFKDHVEIFNIIIGFFMHFEDDRVESAKIVKLWIVRIISISKNKRHQDRAAALEVWDMLEEFVRSQLHT